MVTSFWITALNMKNKNLRKHAYSNTLKILSPKNDKFSDLLFSTKWLTYLSDLESQSVNTIAQYNLRNANDLESVASRTNQYHNSFLPSVVREWNVLTIDVRQSDSLHSFNDTLNREWTIVPKHFFSGIRKAQILHTRLRTNCSSLNNDLYSIHLTDSPLCRCGSVENTNYFFPVFVL